MAEELINAREAMDLLGIAEGELQNMVARGDLRAFRAAGTMKFRRDDVLSMKSEKETQPTIIIPASTTKRPGQSGIIGPVAAPAAGPAAPAMGESPVTAPPSLMAAQATALSARRSLLQVASSRQVAAVALIQALGGGWEASRLATQMPGQSAQ